MKWIFIEPEDVWFFRDSRSFMKGEGHSAVSVIFPPSPMTISGAVRSLILGGYPNLDMDKFKSGKDNSLYNRIGKPGDLGPLLQIGGRFLAKRDGSQTQCYAQLPFDVYYIDQSNRQFSSYKPSQDSIFKSDWNFPPNDLHPLWPPGGERRDGVEQPYWLTPNWLGRYLNQEEFWAVPQSELFEVSPRIGSARDPDLGTAMDRMLYSAPFTHLKKGYGLLVGVNEEIGMPAEKGTMTLGGEGRAARYQVIQENQIDFPPSIDAKNETRIKVVLTTPAYFKQGWYPSGESWEAVGMPPGAVLVSAALGKPQHLGGWDVLNKKPKPMYTVVPAGSVFYFEYSEPLQVSLDPKKLIFTESPEGGEDFRRLGFGKCVIGKWNWQT